MIDVSFECHLVVAEKITKKTLNADVTGCTVRIQLEMEKNPKPARTNLTRTQVLPRTEQNPNPNVMFLTRFFR